MIKKPVLKTLLLSLALFWLPVILLVWIANEVIERKPLVGDVAILKSVHSTFSAGYSNFFLFWTTAGSAAVMAGVTLLLAGVLFYLKKPRSAAIVAFGVGGAAAANVVLKVLFRRDRPSLWHSIVQEHSYSFPSGHAMASSALAFCLIAITWRTRWRWPVLISSLLCMIFVGLSRLYFGVHYPSDVVGGWLVSLLWVWLVVKIVNNPRLAERYSRLLHRNSAEAQTK
jgi:undecaprenyl-diphosphatase